MKHQRLHPHLLKVITNFECIASITSVLGSNTDFSIHGNYRTKGDYVGLCWTSKDDLTNPYLSYTESKDYTGVKVEFDCEYTNVMNLDDLGILPSFVLKRSDNIERYITFGFLRPTSDVTVNAGLFTSSTDLGYKWIKWGSSSVDWFKREITGWEDNFDDKGNYINTTPIYTDYSGIGIEGEDYVIDYVFGILSPVVGSSIMYAAEIDVSFSYHNGNHYIIDFNNLYEGNFDSTKVKVPVLDIKQVTIPIMPTNYISPVSPAIPTDETNAIMTNMSVEFEFKVTNWVTSGSDLNTINPNRPPHRVRLAEGYDDENHRNPSRLISTMVQMGFSGIIDLYIGASHFYDKKGPDGVVSLDYTYMTLDTTKTINAAFKAWLIAYLKEMAANGFTDIVVSVSMENLQMPDAWKQRLSDGSVGQTGWIPPTNFYSPCDIAGKTWIEGATRATLDIVVGLGFKPILQLGEPWWWWETAKSGQPPCIYDYASKLKFKADTGFDMPIISNTSEVLMTGNNLILANWCNAQLTAYSNFMKSIVKSYVGGQYTTLFFLPTVLDPTNTPYFMSSINYIKSGWDSNQLDFIQLEDYDWIMGDKISEYHEDTFYIGEEGLGYKRNKQHYFSGFVTPDKSARVWGIVLNEAYKALGLGFAEVFIWAGTQLRRDDVNVENKLIGELENTSMIRTKQK